MDNSIKLNGRCSHGRLLSEHCDACEYVYKNEIPTLHKKVIQIAPVDNCLYALCEDGEVWYRQYGIWNNISIPNINKAVA